MMFRVMATEVNVKLLLVNNDHAHDNNKKRVKREGHDLHTSFLGRFFN